MTAHSDLASELFGAWSNGQQIEPITDRYPAFDVSDAYSVQQQLVTHILDADGGSTVGYKLGLTSKPMQELLGVDQPDHAPVLSSMVHEDGAVLAREDFIQPKVEAEIALVLDSPLSGPGVTPLLASRALGGAVAAIEIVDSRIRDWRIGLVDTIADVASSGGVVLGSSVVPVDGWDPRLTGMLISLDGAVVATGSGAAALGSPIAAVAWLANTLSAYEVELEAGWFIMTGGLHAAFDVGVGDVVRADFDRLGTVVTSFR